MSELIIRETKALTRILRAIDYFFERLEKRLQSVQNPEELRQLETQSTRYFSAQSDPYYGVFHCINDEGLIEEFRIGRHGPIHDNFSEVLVISYFSKEGDKFSFDPGPNSPLVYKALVKIEENRVIEVDETGTAISELRRQRHGKSRDGEMADVIETVRQDQDKLVRIDPSRSLVVAGGPGTGKTVVGLQRLGFVLFEKESTGINQDVLILGPSDAYSRYVRNFLPKLGFKSVQTSSVDEFLSSVLELSDSEIGSDLELESRASIRDKNSQGLERILLNSIWPNKRLQPISINVSRERRKRAETRVLDVELQEIHDRLRDEFLSGQISYESARARLFTELLFKFREERDEESEKISTNSLEKRRDAMLKFWMDSLRERPLLKNNFESILSTRIGLQIQRELLTIMREYYKDDIEFAISQLSTIQLRDYELEKDAGAKVNHFSTKMILKVLEENNSPRKVQEDEKTKTNQLPHELGTYLRNEIIGDQSAGFGYELWFYIRKHLPNRNPTKISNEVISGRSNVFDNIGVAQLQRLGARLKEYTNDRADRKDQWSSTDIALASLAATYIRSYSKNFSHVVIDEAQDLSKIQTKTLKRLVGSSTFTVLGDVNQATSYGAVANWNDIMALLEVSSFEVGTLTANYRVPKYLFQYAISYLEANDSYNSYECELDGGEIKIIPTKNSTESMDFAERAIQNLGPVGLIGLVCPSAFKREIPSNKYPNVIVIDPWESKGLEVDHLVIVQPNEWFDQTAEMRRLMFVVLTRATKSIQIFQSARSLQRLEPLPVSASS